MKGPLTVYNLIWAFIWCNLFMLVFVLLKRNRKFVGRYGIVPLMIILAVAFSRFFVIWEPWYSRNIDSPVILKGIQDFFRTELIASPSITVLNIFKSVWAIGSIFFITILVKEIHAQRRVIGEMAKLSSEDEERILEEIIRETKPGKSCNLVVSHSIGVPMVAGFRKPTILLPDYNMSPSELKSVMLHEWCHYLNGDAWIKLFIRIFCAVFWWNPLVYLLKKELDYVLELGSDRRATRDMDEDEKLEYVEASLAVIKEIELSKRRFPVNTSGLTSTKNQDMLHARFSLVVEEEKHPRKGTKLLATLALIAVILFSYSFVVQPFSLPIVDNALELSPENSYILVTSDGSYMVYYNNTYLMELIKERLWESPYCDLPIVEE